MLQEKQGVYEFGPFRLDPVQQQLFEDGKPVSLTPKAFDTLLTLVRNHGRLVSKEELLQTVWPDAFVEESTLAQNVFRLRKLLGDGTADALYIETVPKRGYRFIAAVQESHSAVLLQKAQSLRWLIIAGACFLCVAIILVTYRHFRPHPVLTEKDSIVLADFRNTTGDNMFDETLRQALAVEFEQSPFLNVLSRDRLSEQLKLMRRAPDDRLTEPVAREVCQRAGAVVLIAGSISMMGGHYVIGLNAENCQSGDSLGSEQAEAENREKVLTRLAGASAKIRAKLGESLASIQKYDIPIEQATTNSLDALKAYSQAVRLPYGPDIVPLLKRAIELDPSFAAAYSTLGGVYTDLGEYEAANGCYRKAYELRERLTERERFHATADYYAGVVGDLDKANETYRIWQQVYPRDAIPHNDLAYNLELTGQYDRELPEAILANHNDPSLAASYVHLMFAYAAMNRLQDAMGTYQQAEDRKLDDYPYTHYMMYQVATVQKDTAEMERQLAWSKGKPGVEGWMLSFQSDAEGFSGHLARSRELAARASESVRRAGQTESAILIQLNRAWREAEFGNFRGVGAEAASAVKEMPSRDVKIVAALVLARAGDDARAQSIADELERGSAGNVQLRGYWLPAVRAIVDINRQNPGKALADLASAEQYELGIPEPSIEEAAPFLPAYVRGQAYLLMRQGREAAAEFQKLIDYRGVTTNCPVAALAHLQLGRAFRLQGDTEKARANYQDFLNLWRDADADIPILKQAKAEYAQLH